MTKKSCDTATMANQKIQEYHLDPNVNAAAPAQGPIIPNIAPGYNPHGGIPSTLVDVTSQLRGQFDMNYGYCNHELQFSPLAFPVVVPTPTPNAMNGRNQVKRIA